MKMQTTITIILIALLGLAILFFALGQSGEELVNESEGDETVSEPTEGPTEEAAEPDMPLPEDSEPEGDGGDTSDSSEAAPESVTVTFDGSSFSPGEVTVAQGGTVTWESESASDMWVASNVHPTHTLYAGTSLNEHCDGSTPAPGAFDQCSSGATYEFTFEQTGTWEYHDHLTPNATGVVHVVE